MAAFSSLCRFQIFWTNWGSTCSSHSSGVFHASTPSLAVPQGATL